MSETPSVAFKPVDFENFPNLFSSDERTALEKWGKHAEDLTNGVVLPISNDEVQFVSAAKGRSPPVTRFQRVWLRYLQAATVERKLINLGNEIVYSQNNVNRLIKDLKKFEVWEESSLHQRDEEIIPAEELQDKVRRLEVWGKSAWRQLEDLRSQSADQIQRLEARIISMQNKTSNTELIRSSLGSPYSRDLQRSQVDPWDGGGNDWREQS